MREENEKEPCFSTLNLPFLPMPAAATAMHSPGPPSGMATPPLHALASVPFKWEEKPGKPRPCTDIIPLPEPTKCLELPPSRLLFVEPTNKIAKTASPITVLDGPYIAGRPKFSSFRFFREARSSFDSSSGGASPESVLDLLLGKKSSAGKKKRGFLGRIMRSKSGKKEAEGGIFGFSPSSAIGCERGSVGKMEAKMRRNGSFSGLSQASGSAHLWGAVCQSLKQAIPWKSSRKSRK